MEQLCLLVCTVIWRSEIETFILQLTLVDLQRTFRKAILILAQRTGWWERSLNCSVRGTRGYSTLTGVVEDPVRSGPRSIFQIGLTPKIATQVRAGQPSGQMRS